MGDSSSGMATTVLQAHGPTGWPRHRVELASRRQRPSPACSSPAPGSRGHDVTHRSLHVMGCPSEHGLRPPWAQQGAPGAAFLACDS